MVAWLLAGTAVAANELTDSLRLAVSEARQQHDVEAETIAWERLTVTLYNSLEYDSLLAVLPECLEFYYQQKDWEHYYYIWRLKVSAYLYSDRNNTALREVRKMYADAQQRKNDYGVAMASHVMGLAYSNMHYYDEAQKAIERSLKMMIDKDEALMQISIYGDYCEVLSAKKDWKRLLTATEGWHRALTAWGQSRGLSAEAVDSTVFATYCFVAQAKAQRGLGHYDEAMRLLQLATRNAKIYGDHSDEGYWHHVVGELAAYYYDRNDFAKALAYNDEMMYWARQRDVDTELSGAEQQRAEILMELGRYKEAAELWQTVHYDSEERNLKDAKNQLSEMNTLFQLDEMEMAQQKARTRYMMIIGTLVVVALAVLWLLRWRTSRRLKAKNRELAVALARSQESDEMKSAFIRHVSHEIRTPLNIITGFTQILNSSEYNVSSEERGTMLARINDNTRLITQIVNELLELSESEARTAVGDSDTTTAASLCQMAVMATGIKPTPEVDFRLEVDVPDDVVVKTDVQSVSKALSNLLSNAAKFTEQGSITLRVQLAEGSKDEPKRLCFYVIDTGVGVPADARERIFEKFEKVDTFRAGIGLGLNVARSAARRLGGDVTLERSDDSGSVFLLTIPVK